MATVKAYTDLEQSKKLAEILPLDSADMCYPPYYTGDENGDHLYYSKPINEIKSITSRGKDNKDEYIPCWSLVALLRVIPKRIKGYNVLRIDMDEETFAIWYDTMSSGVNNYLPDITKESAVDACYEMIIKLHEQKIL